MELDTDEAARISTLYMYGLLDTDFEERFDRMTRLAAGIFRTPISLISLIDKDRQWFKSSHGMSERQTSRDVAFCSYAIQKPDVFIVPNASEDKRFKDNPLVTAGPHIQFYAGAPLVTRSNHAIGTLCVIDHQPRATFTEDEQSLLKDLADTVMDFFEMQYAMRTAQASERNQQKRTAGA